MTISVFKNLNTGGGGGGPIAISDVTGLQSALDGKAGASDVFSGNYSDLNNLPSLFSGDFDDLTNIPQRYAYFPIWAEESDDLDNSAHEWNATYLSNNLLI